MDHCPHREQLSEPEIDGKNLPEKNVGIGAFLGEILNKVRKNPPYEKSCTVIYCYSCVSVFCDCPSDTTFLSDFRNSTSNYV